MPSRFGVILCLLGGWLAAADGKPVPPPAPASWIVAAPLEHWTAELPSWLKFGAEIRGRSDDFFGLNGVPGRDNSYYLHRLRLNTTVSLAAWLRIVGQAQDSREA